MQSIAAYTLYKDGIIRDNTGKEIDIKTIKNTLQHINIAAEVESINAFAFAGCKSLESVRFEEGSQLESIGRFAFKDCIALKTTEIPVSIESIGLLAFIYCGSLVRITVPLWFMGKDNIWSDSGIDINKTKIICNDTVFNNIKNNNLDISTFPDRIDSNSFKVYIHTLSKSSIEDKESIYKQLLEKVNMESYLECLAYTIKTLGLQTIEIPARADCISNSALTNCQSLKSVRFAEGSQLKSIGNNAFNACRALKTIEIPARAESIGNFAFYNCQSLESVRFAEGSQLKSIGKSSFNACRALKAIEIPESVTEIGNDAFSFCKSLKVLIIPEAYESKNNDYWIQRGLNPNITTIISKDKLRSELDDSLKLTERKIECNGSMLSLLYNLVKDIYSASQIKSSVIKMNAFDFIRSLILVNKTLATEIHTGSQALPSVTINWKKLYGRNIWINNKKFNKKKQTYQVQSLNIPLNLFSKHLTVREMQNLIVATEHRKDKSEKSSEKLENCV